MRNLIITSFLFLLTFSSISKSVFASNDQEAQKAKAQIHLYENMGNEQAAAWMIYAYALIEWDENNENTNCKFEKELNARNEAVKFWINLKNKNKSLRGEQLDAMLLSHMDDFLKEFIWVYYVDPSCEQPQNLRIEEFNNWKAINLKGYKPAIRAIVKYN